MTLNDLRAALDARGIHIEAVGGKLRVDAPLGALTPDLRTALVEHKAALLTAGNDVSDVNDVSDIKAEGDVFRIPLDELVYGDYLARHHLKIVGGQVSPPRLFLADAG